MKNIGELMQKARQVQTQCNILQTKMARQEFTGKAGNGAVSMTLTGHGQAVRVHLDPAVVNPNEVDTLEDLILVAINDARTQAEAHQEAEMEKIQASLGLPPDFKLPF